MKRIIAIATLGFASLVLIGCPAQNTIAALVGVLGSASATIATLEGNTTLAASLQADTAAAVAAVKNWKSGTPSQNVISALNIVEQDLSLFPVSSRYTALVSLAIGTVESIMELVQPGASSGVGARPGVRRVYLATPPKTAAQFKLEWNALANQHSETANAVIR